MENNVLERGEVDEEKKLKKFKMKTRKKSVKPLRNKEKRKCKKRQKNAIKLLHFFIC